MSVGEEEPAGLRTKVANTREGAEGEQNEETSDLEDVLGHPGALARKLAEEKVLGAGGRLKPHTITPRLMRRLWAEIFQITPKMAWDFEKEKWRVEWGLDELRRHRRGRNRSAASVLDEFLGFNEWKRVRPS